MSICEPKKPNNFDWFSLKKRKQKRIVQLQVGEVTANRSSNSDIYSFPSWLQHQITCSSSSS